MRSAAEFRHRQPRVDLRQSAVLTNSSGSSSQVTVLDVSAGGFRVETQDYLRLGEMVTLRVDCRSDFHGKICWALGNQAGGIFLVPMNDLGL